MHALPSEHACPHPPQLKNSVRMSTQFAPHAWSGPQFARHEPSEQTCPAGHTVPQAPQLVESLAMFAGRPPQSLMSPDAVNATQAPLTHVWSLGQTLPTLPQFKLSAAYETQAPATMVRPDGQVDVQVASRHAWLAVQEVVQVPHSA
jgi:hypothetical protein